MPQEEFYAGLPLSAQLRKLADHHADHRVRHISMYEATIIERAAERLERPLSRPSALIEFETVWQRLEHIYATSIGSPSGDLWLQVESVPSRGQSLPSADDLLRRLGPFRVEVATPRNAQIGLNVLARRLTTSDADIVELWQAATRRRSPGADRSLSPDINELLNRALYQPTVAVEESPPAFTSLSSLMDASESGWVAVVDLANNPLEVIAVGGTLIVIHLARQATLGLGQGLRERLYEWARPRPVKQPDEPPTKTSRTKKPMKKAAKRKSRGQ